MSQMIPSADMLEATRLTRAGRLTEAMALLQQHLPGAPATARGSGLGLGPILEGVAETVGMTGAGGMSPLPEALRGLLDRAGRAPRPAPLPEGARFEERSFADANGSRSYRLYVPSHPARQPPLLVMLHGCTQSPEDFAAGTGMNALAEAAGWLVAYPAQSAAANPQRCWNWFKPEDQGRDRGEPALIAGITRAIIAEHGADPARVHVAGLSAGGAQAAIMAATYPDLFAAAGIHSGLAYGSAGDLPSALAAMQQGGTPSGRHPGRLVPTILFHGDQDTTVSPKNAERIVAQVRAAARDLQPTATVQHGKAEGGHRYTRTLHADRSGRTVLEQWLVHGAGHAWSGGSPAGSYTDPSGPDASREMLRFFEEHPKKAG